MSISKSYNKNNNTTYVYDVYENYWDKEKKKYVQKRRMIGKIDPETGEIVPTRSRKKSSAPAPLSASNDDYRTLCIQAQAELEKKDLQISLLNTQIEQLRRQISSIVSAVVPALEKQADLLRSLEQE